MCRRWAVAGKTARRNMVRTRPSITALRAGVGAAFGKPSSPRSPHLPKPLDKSRWTAATGKSTVAPAVQKGAQRQAIDLAKGGRNSKIHAVVDEFCRPWAFVLTPGNTADCAVAEGCVSLIPGVSKLVADKGYDTDAFRRYLEEHGIAPVIPGKSN